MIKTFRPKGLKRFFSDPKYSDKRGISTAIAPRLIVILDALNIIEKPEEMNIAGLYFHALRGERKGEFTVRVTGNWRVTWAMEGKDVIEVNLEDYH
ncbi:MAG: type II toxin-antitoxin system RelE/ParE family toxin [Gammaproteobacteria bacterium]|nr:type II toxin-antitoxin system RelE/ParE family toxin [Gammaproteobacteria bacterium]